ncbi:Cas10/Cmr2 second palm domain-containing protein [Succinimonas sp.]|uniref:Cas10/Cmr2 second palm domain-containing protein n=1 Tax=Succinimonas sp. TaxID=1936151 RepID=UPI00386F8B9F
MEQLSIYLFESKSIQAYLCRTGELRHMINASDKLDVLIGPDKKGLIYQSLRAAGLDPEKDTNLISSQTAGSDFSEDNGKIVFFRYLGGSLSCYSTGDDGYKNLLRFRFALTLAVNTCLPGLQFSDAFVSREIPDNDKDNSGFHKLLKEAFDALAADNNRPTTLLPLATACSASAPKTGEVAVTPGDGDYIMQRLASDYSEVRLSLYIKYLTYKNDDVNSSVREDAERLGKGFLDWVNLSETGDGSEAQGDIALIHMDGNSVGSTLITLRKILKEKQVSRSEYAKVMLDVSQMLRSSTRKAVKDAISDIRAREPNLRFRPLVLGGDDVTLLIQPDYAADFCVAFARAFKEATKEKLKSSVWVSEYLKNNAGKPRLEYLTSSGGILFQKKKHPYATSVDQVDGLARKAKDRKFPNPIIPLPEGAIKVNPSAVAFVRLTESSGEKIGTILERLHKFHLRSKGCDFYIGRKDGFITCENSVDDAGEITLERLVDVVHKQNGGSVISRFRRMLSEVAQGRLNDAEHLFEQAKTMDPYFKNNPVVGLLKFEVERRSEGSNRKHWYYRKKYGLETIINDFLVLDHYINGDGDIDGEDDSPDAESGKEA